jgi:hypothetical protein
VTQIKTGVRDIASICEYVVALNVLDQWIYVDTPISLSQPEWKLVPDLPAFATNKRFIGRLPLLVEGQWVSAGLFNSASASGEAFALYRNPVTDAIETKTWSNRYPPGVSLDPIEGTPNSMPLANVVANWGDFVLLGDIQWKADPAQPYSQSNSVRYPHGIWFSRPGASDTWHPDEVFFIGQKLERNAVLGMFPVEQGLVVVSQSSVSLLRGRPGARAEDFVYEELRTGISPASKEEVTFWPHLGLVVWMDRRGRVWATNGDEVTRLDQQIDIERTGPGCVLGLDEYLFVSGRKDVRVLNVRGETAAWTTLITPAGWQKATFCNSILIGVGADQDTGGDFLLDDEEVGLLDENVLFGFVNAIQVFDLASQTRGLFNNRQIQPVIQTRPLPGPSERTAFWHRFGFRGEGPGRIKAAISHPGSEPGRGGLRTIVNGDLSRRKDWAFNAHGPSIEAVFEFEFEGDVTPEHVTIGAHRGRTER